MGTFFNPFESQKGGGGGGGGDSSTYSVRKIVDSATEQVSYRLTKTTNGSTIDVGEVIAFTGDEVLVDYDGQTILLNAAVENLKELAEQGKQEVTFSSLEIDTHNKTLSQLSAELAAKNLEEGTIVTGRVYSEALPYNNYGNAEVLVNNSIFWWKTSSSTISPYSWNAIVVGNTVKMDWTPTYYQLPIASAQSLGGVKIGDNVQIAPDGTISVITTKGDTGTGIASIAKTSSSGLNDIYTITYTDSTTSTFTVTNGATITGGSIGQTGHLILTMSDGRTIDAGALPTDNEVEVTTTSSQPVDPNVELWVDLSTQQTLDIPEINDSSTTSTVDTWSCRKISNELGAKATSAQGTKADSAVQTIQINGTDQTKTDGVVNLPAYPTKSSLGLENVDNTSDVNKPISTAVATDQTRQDAVISILENNGAKNKLNLLEVGTTNNNHGTTLLTNGITYTVNADKSITISGTASAGAWVYFWSGNSAINLIDLFDGNHVITINRGNLNISLFYTIDGSNVNVLDGEILPASNSSRATIGLQINKNVVIDEPVTIYPMICTKAEWEMSHTFVPYGKTNAELTNENASQQSEINYAVNAGAKNFCPKETETSTGSGFTSDVPVNIPAGTYILSFTGTLAYTASLSFYKALPHSGNSLASISLSATTGTQSVEFTISETAKYIAFYHNGSGNSLTNIMLRPASITDSTFVPYALSNPVITPAIIEQVDSGAKNKLHYDGISTPSGDTANISFSCSGDSITITGSTSSNAAWCYLTLAESIIVANDFCNGKYYLSSERTGSGTVDIFAYESGAGQFADDSGNGVVIPNKTTTNAVRIMVSIPKGATVNITLKIMICTIADHTISPTFVPYRPSWQEMWEMIQELQS